MKIEIAICKTCGATIAATTESSVNDLSWLTSKVKYLKTGNVEYKLIEHPEIIFDKELGKCCGKKIKQ